LGVLFTWCSGHRSLPKEQYRKRGELGARVIKSRTPSQLRPRAGKGKTSQKTSVGDPNGSRVCQSRGRRGWNKKSIQAPLSSPALRWGRKAKNRTGRLSLGGRLVGHTLSKGKGEESIERRPLLSWDRSHGLSGKAACRRQGGMQKAGQGKELSKHLKSSKNGRQKLGGDPPKGVLRQGRPKRVVGGA